MGSIPASAAGREGAMQAAGERVSCWQCNADHSPDFFCPKCGAIQLLPERTDYFQVLGVPRRLLVDADALQRRYYELNRRLHPDLYQTGPEMARQASLHNTAAVNRAYRTLRDPTERALYWLSLHNEKLGSNNNRVPRELATLVFEVQEKLEELRAAGGTDAQRAIEGELAAARTELRQRQAALTDALQENFRRWDAASADAPTLTHELKSILSSLAYLGTLARDVERELDK